MADPRMGDDLPSLYLVDQSDSTGPGVAPREPQSKRPSLSGPVDDIGSVVALVDWLEEGSLDDAKLNLVKTYWARPSDKLEEFGDGISIARGICDCDTFAAKVGKTQGGPMHNL